MKHEKLTQSIESLASDFLFLDHKEIDVPAAGNFLNALDRIAQEAQGGNFREAVKVAKALSRLLEKIVLLEIGDSEKAYVALEKGITVLQQIVLSYENQGKFDKNVDEPLSMILEACGDDRIRDLIDGDKRENGESEKPREEVKAETFEIEDEGLLRDFITEGLEYISEIEVNILNLEQKPSDKDCINAIFRPFHSIKGVAGFLNLSDIRILAHTLENLLDKARNDELEVNQSLIDVVLDGADMLKSMIGRLMDRLEGKELRPLNADMSVLMKKIEEVEKGLEGLQRPQKLGEILVSEGIIGEKALEESLRSSQETAPKKKIGETLIQEGKASPKQVTQALRKQAEQVSDTTTIRIDTRKLDDLIDMVGELVITQSMIQQGLSQQFNADRKLLRTVAQFFRITSELQRISTSLRMMPIKQTFQRMARLARDLGKNAGKQIAVELEGEETEIDRNMVDEIYNPLVHMIRNSVDHGLEPTEERLKAGKSEKGLIRLKAYHRGGNIVIEIADDGRGLNTEKIVNKAKKNGIIGNAENLTEQDIYRLIFLPGFSTAEKVTEVSGRGVGMDVVRQAIDRLRGKMDIESASGKGTTFMTSFPLTLAIIDGMIVKVGSERYILPTTAIRQALRPVRSSYNSIAGKGETINVMGTLLPLVRVYELFNKEPMHRNPWEAIVIVLEGEGRSKCLMVDEIIGKAEVVIKSLGEGLKNIKGISGGAILGDGQIGLIIDTEGLFELSEGNGSAVI